MSDELFREVDEEVRQEQYLKLWKAYGVYIAGVILIVILATVGFVVWRDAQLSKREANGEAMLAAIALADDQPDTAIDRYADLAEEGTKGYRMLARLREGALLSEQGDARGAVAVYDSIAADSANDDLYRDLAQILAVSHGMSIMDRAEVEERLAPINVDGNPWRFAARELIATAAMAAGDSAAARDGFQALADDVNAPVGIRGRAAEMLAVLEE